MYACCVHTITNIIASCSIYHDNNYHYVVVMLNNNNYYSLQAGTPACMHNMICYVHVCIMVYVYDIN